jgi:nitric oxide dioxygenase
MALTAEQIAIVKSTAPVLKEHGNDITAVFYQHLLSENPSLKNMFSLRNQQTGAQQKALANAVLGYATYVDDLPKLKHAVERIAHKHASLFVTPAQYDVVGAYLMRAIGEVLGDALTPEVAEAWTAAYGALAQVFVAREAQLYAANGSWTGWRKFKILRRIEESDVVTSFYLAPVDGAPLPAFLPGQYVSLQVPLPELDGLMQSRQFSLSSAPKPGAEYFRVSVKREDTVEGASAEDIAQGLVPGLVSNMLHSKYHPGDEVELSAPQGEFFVDPSDASKADTPLVLISAGVGATPLVSIVDAVLAPESKTRSRPVTWVQGARSSSRLCFAGHVRSVCRENPNVRAHVFLDEVREGDSKGDQYDYGTTLDLTKLDGKADLFVGDERAEYFICGPEPWMVAVRAKLSEMGVGWDRMHLELFATGDVPGQ